jgi:hypothetical protein
MSHYRNLGGGRRDKNEPEIMQRFRHHGWHPEQVSGNRQWDLNVYPPRPTTTGTNNTCLTLVCHADVKGPKGRVEDAQREKWEALSEKGIPVYVVRTEADVDALVRGDLEPWRPEAPRKPLHNLRSPPRSGPKAGRKEDYSEACCPVAKPCVVHKATAARIADAQREYEASPHCAPPRSTHVDAAREAEETFAPCAADPTGQCDCPAHTRNRPTVCEAHACYEPTVNGGRWCPEHTP